MQWIKVYVQTSIKFCVCVCGGCMGGEVSGSFHAVPTHGMHCTGGPQKYVGQDVELIWS